MKSLASIIERIIMQADLVVQLLMPASNAAFLALFPLVQTGRNWEIKLYHIYSIQIFCSLWRTTSETNKVSWRTVSFKKRQVSYLLLIIQYKNSLSLILKGISKWKWRSGELRSWLLREVVHSTSPAEFKERLDSVLRQVIWFT